MGPAPRIALGLVILDCVPASSQRDVVLGLIPDDASASFAVRKRSAENLAVQLAPLAQRGRFRFDPARFAGVERPQP
jgi:hypothetical protein